MRDRYEIHANTVEYPVRGRMPYAHESYDSEGGDTLERAERQYEIFLGNFPHARITIWDTQTGQIVKDSVSAIPEEIADMRWTINQIYQELDRLRNECSQSYIGEGMEY
jgi:hypothetical protein